MVKLNAGGTRTIDVLIAGLRAIASQMIVEEAADTRGNKLMETANCPSTGRETADAKLLGRGS